MKFKSIKMRTLAIILPLLLVIFGSIISVTYINAKGLLEEQIDYRMKNRLDGVTQSVENYLLETSSIPEQLTRMIEVSPKNYSLLNYQKILTNVFSSNKNAFGGGIFFEPYKYKKDLRYFSTYAYWDQNAIKTTQKYSDVKFDYTSQDWYQIATNTDKPVVLTSPYLDTNVNVSMVTATAPFYDQQKQFLGVVTADIDLSQIQKTIEDIQVEKTGYAFLIDNNGTYIAAPDSEKVMKAKITEDNDANLAKLGSQIIEKKNGSLRFTNSSNVDTSLFFKKIPNTNWTIGLVVPDDELYASLSSLSNILIIVSLVGIALIVLVILFYNQSIVKNINKVNDMALTLANGDFQHQLDIKSQDEFGKMAGYLNQMKDNFLHIIQQVKSQSDQVAATSEELSAIAEETSTANVQINNAIQEVAIGSKTQVERTTHSTEVAEEITTRMEQALGSNTSISNLISETNDKANNGSAVVRKAISQIDLVHQTTEETASRVDELGEKSKQINQIVDLITAISEQTNLLALNASIEAARAGENGRGFAVVANEVKTLAQQSQEAAKNISVIIEDIESEVEKTVTAMNNNKQMVQDGLEFVNQSGKTFNEIAQMIGEVAKMSKEVSDHLMEVNNSSEEMVKDIENVANIAEQASERIQNVAMSAKEQNLAMGEIAVSAETLKKMAQELQESTSMFKI